MIRDPEECNDSLNTTRMNADEFIKGRVDDQIEWYASAAASAKWRYLGFSVMNLVGSASIPLLSGYVNDNSMRFVVGAVGAGLAVIAGVLTLFKWQENWIQFRATSEALKHEKYLFLSACSPYDGADKLRVLAQRIEGMISKENSSWAQYIKPAKTADTSPQTEITP